MVGKSLAGTALLCFARGAWTDESVCCIVLSVLWLQGIILWIFFGGILRVSLCKFELRFAFTAAYKIEHLL